MGGATHLARELRWGIRVRFEPRRRRLFHGLARAIGLVNGHAYFAILLAVGAELRVGACQRRGRALRRAFAAHVYCCVPRAAKPSAWRAACERRFVSMTHRHRVSACKNTETMMTPHPPILFKVGTYIILMIMELNAPNHLMENMMMDRASTMWKGGHTNLVIITRTAPLETGDWSLVAAAAATVQRRSGRTNQPTVPTGSAWNAGAPANVTTAGAPSRVGASFLVRAACLGD